MGIEGGERVMGAARLAEKEDQTEGGIIAQIKGDDHGNEPFD